jgi:hypothetical protein
MYPALVLAGSIVSIVGAIGAVASVLGVIVALRRVQQVHVIVNSANMALRAEVKVLVRALQEAGVKIPKSPEEEE